MKKKLIIAASIITVMVVAVVALVSCATTPLAFMKKFASAESFTIESAGDNMESTMIYDKGNISFITKSGEDIVFGAVSIVNGDNVDFYAYNVLEKKWVKSSMTINGDEYSELKEQINSMKTTVLEQVNVTAETKDDPFVKEGEYYFAKAGDAVNKEIGYKITSNKLEVYEKEGDSYKHSGSMKLSGKVTAPIK